MHTADTGEGPRMQTVCIQGPLPSCTYIGIHTHTNVKLWTAVHSCAGKHSPHTGIRLCAPMWMRSKLECECKYLLIQISFSPREHTVNHRSLVQSLDITCPLPTLLSLLVDRFWMHLNIASWGLSIWAQHCLMGLLKVGWLTLGVIQFRRGLTLD